MTTRKIPLFLITALLIAISATMTRAQSSEGGVDAERHTTQSASQGGLLDVLEQIKQAQAQRFEGSWAVTVTPVVPPGAPQPPSFRAYATVSRGGAYFGSDRTRPFSKQHGVWAHLGGNDFAYTINEDLFDALGNFAGMLTVRVKLTVTGNDTFVGVANGEQRDAAGNLVFNRCTTVRGERIKVEPLAPQCQSITPPQ
jgi:hypothetical protein